MVIDGLIDRLEIWASSLEMVIDGWIDRLIGDLGLVPSDDAQSVGQSGQYLID